MKSRLNSGKDTMCYQLANKFCPGHMCPPATISVTVYKTFKTYQADARQVVLAE